MRITSLARFLPLLVPCLAGHGPALAEEASPLEIACPAEAGRACAFGLVDGGRDGKVLVLHADEPGLVGRRVALEVRGGGDALLAYAGKVLILDYRRPPDPPSAADAPLGGPHLLYVVAPIAPTKPDK